MDKKIIRNIGFSLSGALFGILFNNIFLAIVLGAFGFLAQKQIEKIKSNRDKKKLNERLRVSMGIITGSYIQNNDIVKSVNENINRIPEQVKEVFQNFLVETNFIHSDIENAISKMGMGVENRFFREWCNCLLQCQRDRELKYILLTITEKMLDARKVQEELDSMMFSVYRDFLSVVIIALCSLPFMFFMNREWFYILTNNVPGQIITAVVYLGAGLSCVYAVKINKPVMLE